MAESIIKPLRPTGLGWSMLDLPPDSPLMRMGYPVEAWYHTPSRTSVLSAVEVAKDDDGIDRGPEYHISISLQSMRGPSRISSEGARLILREFGIDGAEEDNHVPHGVVRNFWRPVAEPMVGLECACKAEEPAIVEDKGDFVWRP